MANSDTNSDQENDYSVDMFTEPAGFRPPSPEPSYTVYTRPVVGDLRQPETTHLSLNLVAKHRYFKYTKNKSLGSLPLECWKVHGTVLGNN